ncbi:MAG: c-type cytochrome [Granulosicoccus sp.]|nr:c-type cytochrome [Granulosicoccus sp.]
MTHRILQLVSVLLTLFISTSAQAASTGNPVKGAELFKQCTACHMVGEDAQNTVGPNLNHIFGRKAAAVEGYNYSDAMKAKGEEGLLWEEKSLYTFIAGPKWFVPGTIMGFEGLRREKEIKDLLSWLIQFSPAYTPDSMTEVSSDAAMAATLPAYTAEDDTPEDPQLTEAYLAEAEPIKIGGELWAKQCRHCHGNSAYPGKAPKLKPATYKPDFVFDRLTNGFRKMPAWKTVFTLDERRAIVSYVLSDSFSP